MGMFGVTAPLVGPVAALGAEPTKPPFGNAGFGDEPGMVPLPTLGETLHGVVP